MLNILIPSKDRACQLDLLLRSIEKNIKDCANLDFHIIYSATTPDFQKGYDKLAEKYDDRINLIPEVDFTQQIKDVLTEIGLGYVGFFVDDCIFYRPYYPTIKETLDLFSKDVWCFSWRLGLNTTTQYYLTGEQQDHLEKLGVSYIAGETCCFIKWNWKIRPSQKNYGYCFSLDGHIYRADDLYEKCYLHDFHNPRSFESLMTRPEVRHAITRRHMVAGVAGHIVVNTINCTQAEKVDAGIFYSYSVDFLNSQFLNGQIIDLDGFDFSCISGCHDELPIKFITE